MKKLVWTVLILFGLLFVAALWQFRGSRTMNDPQTLASLVGKDGKLDDEATPESFKDIRLIARPYKRRSLDPDPHK